MTNIMKHEKPKVTSLERLAELAEQKRAVVFNNGIIKPAAVVLNMQGALISAMIRNENLFEYIKPMSKSSTFYRSGKARKPRYTELEAQNKEMKAIISEVVEAITILADPKKVDAIIDKAKKFI